MIEHPHFSHPQQVISSAVSKEVMEVKHLWQEKGASVLRSSMLQQQLTHLYTFREPLEVLQFLEEYPQGILLLVEAYKKSRITFQMHSYSSNSLLIPTQTLIARNRHITMAI